MNPLDAAVAVAGPRNDITDVAGLAVGHHQRRGRNWLTGTTVVLPPPGTVGGVDVRGGGPGTRETDCLDPTTMVSRVDAVCLSGGSAYGLDAAGGVMSFLAARNRGFPVGPGVHHVVPIVPAAVLFDLDLDLDHDFDHDHGASGRFHHRPDASFGFRAAGDARCRTVRQGTVGAGTGAHAARLKGGIGSASVVLANGITVSALVALNSGGSPVNPRTGELWGAARGLAGEFAHLRSPSKRELRAYLTMVEVPPPLNTTLAIIATDAILDKHECTRLAGAGHDGMARAIDPIHQYGDGDVVFALATRSRAFPASDGITETRLANVRFRQLSAIIAAAADTVARAVVHAMLHATSAGPMMSYRDQFPSAIGSLAAESRLRSSSSTVHKEHEGR